MPLSAQVSLFAQVSAVAEVPMVAKRSARAGSVAPDSAFALLDQAEHGLAAAAAQPGAAQRFADAYLCALRAAAALLATRGRPHRGRAKPTSVWTLLASVAPEMREWAAFFASCSATRAAVQAGITSRVGPRAADDLVRQSAQFISLVHRAVHGVRR
ncbi:MAG TPA: SAV_6107 family HEPN domain-containing protein [Actinokineospora sp.]|nr:SAV_6107 family HEPN domain-containing protein [Actinokineospora sp.]